MANNRMTIPVAPRLMEDNRYNPQMVMAQFLLYSKDKGYVKEDSDTWYRVVDKNELNDLMKTLNRTESRKYSTYAVKEVIKQMDVKDGIGVLQSKIDGTITFFFYNKQDYYMKMSYDLIRCLSLSASALGCKIFLYLLNQANLNFGRKDKDGNIPPTLFSLKELARVVGFKDTSNYCRQNVAIALGALEKLQLIRYTEPRYYSGVKGKRMEVTFIARNAPKWYYDSLKIPEKEDSGNELPEAKVNEKSLPETSGKAVNTDGFAASLVGDILKNTLADVK